MTPRIGAMWARITVQREDATPAGGGGYDLTWTDVVSLWAEITPLGGREARQGERQESRVTHRLTIRYRDDVTAGMRALFDGRVFNIRAVVDDGLRKHFTHLLAEEGGAT